MAMTSRKRRSYRVSDGLFRFLRSHGRAAELPVSYTDLTRYDDSTPVYDKRGRDTLWQSVLYPSSVHRAHDPRAVAREPAHRPGKHGRLARHGGGLLIRSQVMLRSELASLLLLACKSGAEC